MTDGVVLRSHIHSQIAFGLLLCKALETISLLTGGMTFKGKDGAHVLRSVTILSKFTASLSVLSICLRYG